MGAANYGCGMMHIGVKIFIIFANELQFALDIALAKVIHQKGNYRCNSDYH